MDCGHWAVNYEIFVGPAGCTLSVHHVLFQVCGKAAVPNIESRCNHVKPGRPTRKEKS